MKGNLKELNRIQWLFTDEFDDSVLQGVSTNRIFEYVKKIDKLPIESGNGEIYFSSDTWDFNSVTLKSVPKRKSEFKFIKVSNTFKEQLKFFTLSKIWEDIKKIQSIYKSVGEIKDFLNYLVLNDIYSLEYVSLLSVKKIS